MSFNIGIEDLAANALIESMRRMNKNFFVVYTCTNDENFNIKPC